MKYSDPLSNAEGWKESGRVEELSRLHAPIGLDIGAASPAEIAVAILADIVLVLHARRLPPSGGGGT